MEKELDRLDDVELLDGDFLPDDGSNVVPLEFRGGMTQLVTRLATAKQAGVSYSRVLEWQQQGLLHPVRLNFSRRPEIFYSQREVDQVLKKLSIMPQKAEPPAPPPPIPPPSQEQEVSIPEPWAEIERLQTELIDARSTAESERARREVLEEQLAHERREKAMMIKHLSTRRRRWRRKSTSR